MAELAKDPRFQKIYSTTEVVMASEQTCSPTAITAATAAATPVTNTATPITNHQEQFAAAATTAAAQVDTAALDRLEQFKLLASLSIPILNAPCHPICKMSRKGRNYGDFAPYISSIRDNISLTMQ